MAEILLVDDDDAIRGRLVAVLRSARHTDAASGRLRKRCRRSGKSRLTWVAFEFFPMGDLAGPLRQGIAPHLACRIVVQVAAGLGALHRAGIVHRDVKPANIMVRSANAFVMTDFGTAKRVRVDTTLTPDGRIIS